jgi:hypothetical protein
LPHKGCGVVYRDCNSTAQVQIMKTLNALSSPLSSHFSTASLLAIAAAGLLFNGAARADAFSTAIGGGVGAVAGAVIGDRVGGRDAAIIGSGVGGAIGAVVGQSVGQPAVQPVYPAYPPPSRGYTIVQPAAPVYAPVYSYPRQIYYPAYRVESYRDRGWGHDRHHHRSYRDRHDHHDRHDHRDHDRGRYWR